MCYIVVVSVLHNQPAVLGGPFAELQEANDFVKILKSINVETKAGVVTCDSYATAWMLISGRPA